MDKTEKKIPHTLTRNIRFKDAAQIAMIKRAAEHHDLSFNTFVVQIMEQAAVLALDLSPVTFFDRIIFKHSASSRKQARSK